MISVPGFLLRRLYVTGSLGNNEGGFQFQIKNMLGSGYARKLQPLTVDGDEVPLADALFQDGSRTISFSEVSEDQPFTLPMNRSITILIRGPRLAPGIHKLTMGFDVPGLGTLQFDFTDAIPES